MNRQQRRLAEHKQKKKEASLDMSQKRMIANSAYNKGYVKGQEKASADYDQVFMYAFILILKTLQEQWGWGHTRLSRLTEQVLKEYNDNDMSLTELKDWCWNYIGFKLQVDEDTK